MEQMLLNVNESVLRGLIRRLLILEHLLDALRNYDECYAYIPDLEDELKIAALEVSEAQVEAKLNEVI
jgi:hypothetical protein